MSRPSTNYGPSVGAHRFIERGLLVGMLIPLVALRESDPGLADATLIFSSCGYAVGAALLFFRALATYQGPGAQGALWRIIAIFVAGFMPTLSMALWSQDRPEVLYPAFYWCASGCAFGQFVALFAAYWLVSTAEARKEPG